MTPLVPVPARIVAKRPGQSWDWRVGPVVMRHEVQRLARGCEVRIEVRAARAVELAVDAGYGPLISLVLLSLARLAADPGDFPTVDR